MGSYIFQLYRISSSSRNENILQERQFVFIQGFHKKMCSSMTSFCLLSWRTTFIAPRNQQQKKCLSVSLSVCPSQTIPIERNSFLFTVFPENHLYIFHGIMDFHKKKPSYQSVFRLRGKINHIEFKINVTFFNCFWKMYSIFILLCQ